MHLSATTPLMALVAVLFSLATQALSAAVPEPHANIGARAPSPPPPTEECSYPDSCRINPALCCVCLLFRGFFFSILALTSDGTFLIHFLAGSSFHSLLALHGTNT
ncbi:unnamed protein product [Zymoseptoria tritici ST99CH_3D7]|uniref:Uncharacterized protein n=1 Tax=Zymoseptoria tritici (strain ST99CH_3D7) TaxID=1276538 RepID=A0A1X7RIA7_ZYMT9|nr:unnamed protein product [Zymoseptoria tritici ST99CH_3D7]